MTKVEAFIRPQKLDEVQQALSDIGVHGLTVTEVRGAGKQKGFTQHYRGAEYTTDFVPKVKIEVFVTDNLALHVIETITRSAKTGTVGDGKIFMSDLGSVVRIRTGEMGESAL